jgi:uncharacterized protein (DUF1778 family)
LGCWIQRRLDGLKEQKIRGMLELYGNLPYSGHHDLLENERGHEMATFDLNADAPKTARLEVRSTPTQKSIIEKAASLLGESVTSFVLATALKDAIRVIHDYQITELSLTDWARFEAILEVDVEPAANLQDALKQYEAQVVHSDG